MLPKASAYVKSYDGETKCMDDNLMKKHNDAQNKVSNSIKK